VSGRDHGAEAWLLFQRNHRRGPCGCDDAETDDLFVVSDASGQNRSRAESAVGALLET